MGGVARYVAKLKDSGHIGGIRPDMRHIFTYIGCVVLRRTRSNPPLDAGRTIGDIGGACVVRSGGNARQVNGPDSIWHGVVCRLLRPENSGPLLCGVPMGEQKKPLPYLRWYVADYRASRRVQRLSWQERGIYRELLDECWVEGSIPDDPERLAEIAGCPTGVMAEAWKNLRPMFQAVDGLDGMYLTSRRLEIERSEDDAFRVKMANAGRKGGLAKASKAKQGLARPSQQLEQLEQSKSSSAASASASPPLGGASASAEELATPEQMRAILDHLRGFGNGTRG